jgi:hypothetical protein
MTATLRILIYAPGDDVNTGPELTPIRARVLRAQVLVGGGLRYELGWWKEESWLTGWFPASEVRAIEEETV